MSPMADSGPLFGTTITRRAKAQFSFQLHIGVPTSWTTRKCEHCPYMLRCQQCKPICHIEKVTAFAGLCPQN
eukprot:2714801-Amphidinium_carterae.1